jgi:putative peptidoglycan lipid II flippase
MARGLFKAGLALFLISIVSKLLGFFREVLIANFFGTSYSADAYYIALTPSTLAITFSIAISSVFLPLFVKYSEDKKQSYLFANNVLFLFFAGVTVFYVLMLSFTDIFIKILAPGLPAEAENLSVLLLKYLLPLVFIVIAIQIYTLMLNTFDDYIKSAASVIPNNLIIIGYLFIFGETHGIVGVAIVTLIANIFQLVLLYYLIRNTHKYQITKHMEFWGPNSKVFLILLLPVIVSSAFSQLNAVVDRILASQISEGAIASLSYAFRLRGIATGIFITPIITLTFPKLAKFSQNKDHNEVYEVTRKSIYTVFAFLIPLTIIFLNFSKEIIEILFERGKFDSQATIMTSAVFWAYSLGILSIGFREVTLRVSYSYGDTKTPTYIMVIGSLANVALSYLLIKPLGLLGLGLSSSLSFLIVNIITIYMMRNYLQPVWSKPFLVSMGRMAIGGLIVGLSIYALKAWVLVEFPVNNLLGILVIGIYAILSYACFIFSLYLLKDEEILTLLNQLKRKILKRKNY